VQVKRAAIAVLIAFASSVAAGCGSGPSALWSMGGWGSGAPAAVGKRMAMAGIPLCTRGHTPVTITSIEPVTVAGDIHVDQLLVSRGRLDDWAIYPGRPPRSRPAAGFTIPAPTTPCGIGQSWIPRYQAIILAHRTGPRYGSVDGLRVKYRVGDARGTYIIDVSFCLHGKGAPVGTAC